MTLPGLTVRETDVSPVQGAPTDTGRTFIVAEAERGPTTATLVRSPQDAVLIYGEPTSYSFLHDALDAAFADGATEVYVARATGPDAAPATLNLQSRLTITAASLGAWGNALNVAVLDDDGTGGFKLQVTHDTDGILATSPDLADNAAAIDWLEATGYVTAVLGSNPADPAVAAAASLAGGDDDRDAIGNDDWIAALDALGPELGPGQVTVPGIGTTAVHIAVAAHCLARNRKGELDAPLGANRAAIIVLLQALHAVEGARRVSLWCSWGIAPARAGGSTVRRIPYSATQAGMTARYDRSGRMGDAIANGDGRSVFLTGLDVEFTAADRQALNEAGGSVAIVQRRPSQRDVVMSYADRVATDVPPSSVDYAATAARTTMSLRAQGAADFEELVLGKIDGRNTLEARGFARLAGSCKRAWELGALFGETTDDAYVISVESDPVERVLTGRIAFTPSPGAERVTLEIGRRAVS